MSITAMYGNTIHINKLRSAGYGDADFDVETMPLWTTNRTFEAWRTRGKSLDDVANGTVPMQRVVGKVVSVRPDTGHILGVHGNRYKAVTHKAMIDTLRSIIERSDLDAASIGERIVTANNGARAYVTYKLPNHSIITPDGDRAIFSLLGTNSFDGSFSFILSGGAEQGACMNMQVFTKGAATMYKARHTLSLDLDHGARIITNGLEVMETQADLWHEWAKISVEDGKEQAIFAAFTDFKEGSKNSAYTYLLDKYRNHYKKAMGANLWALYNTLTDWSTHAPTRSKKTNVANLAVRRQEKVRGFISADSGDGVGFGRAA